MIPRTPTLLIGTATAFIGSEDAVHHTLRRVELVQQMARRIRENPANRWDAEFVQYAGYRSHYDHRSDSSSWPFPMTRATAHQMAELAREQNVLDPRPELGDLYVLWSAAKKRYVHIGIVLTVERTGEFPNGRAFVQCAVLSPNVHEDGRIGGPHILRLSRRICPASGDAFIRWTEMDAVGQEVKEVSEMEAEFTELRRAA